MLWSQEVTQGFERSTPSLETIPEQVRVVDTPQGAVLVLNLPAIHSSDSKAMQAYVTASFDSIAATDGLARSCALVVNLSGQTGGNAWPPMLVLEPLFTAQNTAQFVAREDKRFQVAHPAVIQNVKRRVGEVPPNPLERFRGQNYGVVLARSTASAGEMIAMALQGEPGRSRSFGSQTYGMTTANQTVQMPDNALLLLTTSRYAFGMQAAIRGKLQPDVPTSAHDAVQQAAEWAAAQSPACTPVTPKHAL
ncbi:S41 family peptidase [Massilia sp. SR12]